MCSSGSLSLKEKTDAMRDKVLVRFPLPEGENGRHVRQVLDRFPLPEGEG